MNDKTPKMIYKNVSLEIFDSESATAEDKELIFSSVEIVKEGEQRFKLRELCATFIVVMDKNSTVEFPKHGIITRVLGSFEGGSAK